MGAVDVHLCLFDAITICILAMESGEHFALLQAHSHSLVSCLISYVWLYFTAGFRMRLSMRFLAMYRALDP